MKCSNCQKEIDDDSKFCEFCGNNISTRGIVDKKTIITKIKIKEYVEKNKDVIIITLLFLLVVIFLIIAIDLHTYTAPHESSL